MRRPILTVRILPLPTAYIRHCWSQQQHLESAQTVWQSSTRVQVGWCSWQCKTSLDFKTSVYFKTSLYFGTFLYFRTSLYFATYLFFKTSLFWDFHVLDFPLFKTPLFWSLPLFWLSSILTQPLFWDFPVLRLSSSIWNFSIFILSCILRLSCILWLSILIVSSIWDLFWCQFWDFPPFEISFYFETCLFETSCYLKLFETSCYFKTSLYFVFPLF